MFTKRFLCLAAAVSCCLFALACGDDDDSCVCTVGEVVPLCQEKCSPTNKPQDSTCTRGIGGQAGAGGQANAGGAGGAGATCQ